MADQRTDKADRHKILPNLRTFPRQVNMEKVFRNRTKSDADE